MSSLTNPRSADEEILASEEDAREVARLLCLKERRLIGPNGRAGELKRQARAVIAERARRARFFGRAMLGEPAWDILLQLYVSDGSVLAIRDLVLMTEEPKSTAIRWVAYLEEKRLVARRPDRTDRRMIRVKLLERGRALLDAYFSEGPRFADIAE